MYTYVSLYLRVIYVTFDTQPSVIVLELQCERFEDLLTFFRTGHSVLVYKIIIRTDLIQSINQSVNAC